MNDIELDEILKRAAQSGKNLDPAILERIATSVRSSLAPVRPLPPSWILESSLAVIAVAVAAAGTAHAGFFGVQRLAALPRVLIFSALAFLLWMAATACVGEMIPGSRRRVSPAALLGIGSLGMLAVFAFLFRDYRVSNFVPAGLACLAAGLLYAIPAGLLSWPILRRGFSVNIAAAGLATGTLAGLAGVTMLELHCPNFQALHILLWHTAVLPLSGAAGALLAWLLDRRPASYR